MVGRDIRRLPLVNGAGDGDETIPDGHAPPIFVRRPLDLISGTARSPEEIRGKGSCTHTIRLGTCILPGYPCTFCIVGNAHVCSLSDKVLQVDVAALYPTTLYQLLHFLR